MAATDKGSQRELRHDQALLRRVLDKLDESAGDAATGAARQNDRFAYRVRALIVELQQSTGDWVRHAVPTRNISRDGLGFLLGNFVYPRTECRVNLVSIRDHAVTVPATVVRCRYLEGTGTLYEVGARFKHPIDVSMFHRSATRTSILLVDDDPAMGKLVAFLLKSANCTVTCAASADEGLKLATESTFDLIFVDIEMPGKSGLEMARELNAGGYARPIVALTGADEGEMQAEFQASGCSLWLNKPVTREALLAVVNGLKGGPLISSLVQESGIAPLIDEFVAGLKQRLSEIGALHTASDLENLKRCLRRLRGDAGSYGFAPIMDAVAEFEKALAAGGVSMLTRTKLNVLASWCLAARPASCEAGAAR